jgi:hypothetical protein
MNKITLNKESRLYNIHCQDGYSCLGFEVLEKRMAALGEELQIIIEPVEAGTVDRYNQYQKLIEVAAGRNKLNGWRSQSELTPELIGLEGKKVKVTHKWPSGETETVQFIVGKSTGFIPCHLELESKNPNSGGAVCLGEIISVERK